MTADYCWTELPEHVLQRLNIVGFRLFLLVFLRRGGALKRLFLSVFRMAHIIEEFGLIAALRSSRNAMNSGFRCSEKPSRSLLCPNRTDGVLEHPGTPNYILNYNHVINTFGKYEKEHI